jgi:phage terminase large subunit-like protein
VPDDVAVWLAADASIRRDCAALAVVTVYRDVVLELETWVWEWDGEEKGIDYDTTLIPQIKAAIGRFKVMGVAYDEYQLHQPMTALSKQYRGLPFFPFPQGTERLRGDTNLLTRINERKLRHSGNPLLKQHVLNAAAKEVVGGEAIRIVKRTERQTNTFGGELVTAKPIDAIIAVSMAAHYATELWEEEQVVYDDTLRAQIGDY